MDKIDCPLCGNKFEEDELDTHKSQVHSEFTEMYAKEDFEEMDFFTPPDGDEDQATCDICGAKVNPNSLKQHLLDNHINVMNEAGSSDPLKKVADISESEDWLAKIKKFNDAAIDTSKKPIKKTEGKAEDEYAVYDNQQDAENQQDERKEETYEVDEDYTETCPECGKVFDNPADAGFHAVKHDTDRANEEEYVPSEEPIGGKIENDQKTIGFPTDKRSYDVEEFEPDTSNYEVDVDEYTKTGEPTQKLPTDKRADEPNDDWEEHPEKLEENWHKISTENRVKLFEAVGLTQSDAYTLAGLDYRYLTESIKKDIAKEARYNFDLEDTTKHIDDKDEEEKKEEEETDEAYEFIYNLEKNHRSRDFKKKNLICTRCNESFYRSIDRNVHFNEVHMNAEEYELPDQCPFCKEIIQEPETLDWHMQEQHGAHIPSTYTQTGIQGAMADTDDFGIDQDFYKESKAKEDFDFDAAEPARAKLLLDGYKSGEDWVSDPKRLESEDGSFEGWLSYSKKFNLDEQLARKVWSGESRASNLKKEIKKLTNFINMASFENPMNMGDDQAKLDSLKAELASLGESRAKELFGQDDPDEILGGSWGTPEDTANDLYNMTSHNYNQDEYFKWVDKIGKKVGRNDTGKFDSNSLDNWLQSQGVNNQDMIFDLVSEFGGGSKAIEARANEDYIPEPYSQHFEWVASMDQDDYVCKHCGQMMMIDGDALHTKSVSEIIPAVQQHLANHGITESYAKEDWSQYDHEDLYPTDPAGDEWREEGTLMQSNYDMSQQDMNRLYVDAMKESLTRAIQDGGEQMNWNYWENLLNGWNTHTGIFDLPGTKGETPEAQQAFAQAHQEVKNWFRDQKQSQSATYPSPSWESIKNILNEGGPGSGPQPLNDSHKSALDKYVSQYGKEDKDIIMSLASWDKDMHLPPEILSQVKDASDSEILDYIRSKTGESKATEQNADKLMEDLMDEDGNPPDELGVDDAVSYLTKMGVPENEAKDAVKRFGGAID